MDKPVQPTVSTQASLQAPVVSSGRVGAALARAIDIASEHHCSMSLIAVGIDNKAVHTARHDVSDDVLEQRVGGVLASMLRNIDLIGYVSGGFMIITAPSFHFEGEEIAMRLTRAINAIDITDLPELTLSCGIAAYRPGDTATSMHERAVAALERSQARGEGLTEADDVDESQFSP